MTHLDIVMVWLIMSSYAVIGHLENWRMSHYFMKQYLENIPFLGRCDTESSCLVSRDIPVFYT